MAKHFLVEHFALLKNVSYQYLNFVLQQLKSPLPTLMHCAPQTQILRILCYTKLLMVMKGFSKDLVLGQMAQAIHSKKIVICSNSLDYMIEENCHLFERLVLCIQNNIIVSHTIVPNHLHLSHLR